LTTVTLFVNNPLRIVITCCHIRDPSGYLVSFHECNAYWSVCLMAPVTDNLWWLCNLCVCVSSRNNGYAISTPTQDQYRGDGIGTVSNSRLI